jgi:carbon storage regulator
MLVLSRKIGEKIVIDHQIVITVLDCRGDTIKLGIDAPRHITIHRLEVYEDIMRSNQQASSSIVSPAQSLPPAGYAGDATSQAMQAARRYVKPKPQG